MLLLFAGHEDSERDDVTSYESSVDEKRYYERKLSPTTIDKSDGFVRADRKIVTIEVAVADVPYEEPSKPPNEEEAISWLVNRASWLPRPARRSRPLALSPVPYPIVSETSDDRNGSCLDSDSCRREIRRRQLYTTRTVWVSSSSVKNRRPARGKSRRLEDSSSRQSRGVV
uniref:Uncharacterized protein n=1 Tax=Trichogramma kaykai TaxID=54128 RepID=A0ABD2XT62_9HYME